MIRFVRSDHPQFKDVEFRRGLNVVLADRTRESTRQDTRNGLGKSTLIDIIHFCLGSNPDKKSTLGSPALNGWTFSVGLQLGGREITAFRTVGQNSISVDGDLGEWPIQPQERDLYGRGVYPLQQWNAAMGALLFGLEVEPGRGTKYAPSFRGLFAYVSRRNKGGYLSPFSNHDKQQEWDKQVSNAYLLGLNWEDAQQWQVLRDRQKDVEAFQRGIATGFARGLFGSLGELEAEKVRLQVVIREREEALSRFRVHPQYRDIEREADELTREIHELANANVLDRRLLESYREGGAEEPGPSGEDIARMYEEASVALPEAIRRRLEDVEEFHSRVVTNRRAFLLEQIARLERDIERRDLSIAALTENRAERLEILKTHGALEEYVRLQEQHTRSTEALREVDSKIEALKRLQRERGELRIEFETLRQGAQLRFDAFRDQRDRAIELFNDNSEALYQSPGSLVIDIGPTGFKFDVIIQRSKSQGIENMKVFCYDLAIAELWTGRDPSPRLLIHDSLIFDGVDERQVALALQLIASRSSAAGFQYICTMNSDVVPWKEFEPGFDLNEFVVRRLTDASEEGSLLGIRF